MITITKLSTPTCQPCKKYDPILDKVEQERDDVKVVRYDITTSKKGMKLAQDHGISGVPFTIFSDNNGEFIGEVQGVVNLENLHKVLDSVVG